MIIYVVTGVDLGWDCVCGAYTSKETAIKQFQGAWFDEGEEITEQLLQDNGYIIHEVQLFNGVHN